MKKILLVVTIVGTLSACNHGGSIGIDAEKSTSATVKTDLNMSKEKSISATASNAKKETMPALMLLGGATSEYVAPMLTQGAGRLLPMLADYIAISDKKGIDPTLKDWPGVNSFFPPNKLAIALMASSLSPQIGWPHELVNSILSFSPPTKKARAATDAFLTAATTQAIFANNLYAKSAATLGQASLKNQGEAKDIALDFILKMPVADIESIFAESLMQARQVSHGATIDGQQKLGVLGWMGNGTTVYGDQTGWHIQKAGNTLFGGDSINGKSIMLSMDNTLDNVLAKKKINSEATESAAAATTKITAGLK